MMTQRAWSLGDDPAGVGTAMITTRAVPALSYLPITGMSPGPRLPINDFADHLVPDLLSRLSGPEPDWAWPALITLSVKAGQLQIAWLLVPSGRVHHSAAQASYRASDRRASDTCSTNGTTPVLL
jgi:hypothetical protein